MHFHFVTVGACQTVDPDLNSKMWLYATYCWSQYHVQDRSLGNRTVDAIFGNTILKCSKTELLEIPHAKSKTNKDSNGIGVRIRERWNCL